MTCRTAERWVSEDLDGRLSPGAKIRLARHLASCADCRAYRGRLEIIQREARGILNPVLQEGHGDDWENRLRARLEAVAGSGGTSAPECAPRPAWKWAWAGTSAVFLAVLAFLFLTPRRPVEEWPAFYPGDAEVYLENEMARNPALAENINRILAESIAELLKESGVPEHDWLWDDPFLWENLSLEEMKMIEADMMISNET